MNFIPVAAVSAAAVGDTEQGNDGKLCGKDDVILFDDGDCGRWRHLTISGDVDRVPTASVASSAFVAARTERQRIHKPTISGASDVMKVEVTAFENRSRILMIRDCYHHDSSYRRQ